jgi:hypothetical protein
MTKMALVWLGACVVSVVALQPIASAASGPTRYHSDRYGYTITLPAGWARAPGDQMRIMREAAREESAVEVDAGFYNALKGGFGYPYVAVLFTPYRGGRMPTESAMRELVASRARARPGTTRAGFSADTKSYVIEHPLTTPETGRIQVMMCGHFGKRGLIEIAGFSRENEYGAVEPVFRRLDSTFAFDPEAELEDPGGAKIGGTMRIVLVGLGGVLVLLILLRVFRR